MQWAISFPLQITALATVFILHLLSYFVHLFFLLFDQSITYFSTAIFVQLTAIIAACLSF